MANNNNKHIWQSFTIAHPPTPSAAAKLLTQHLVISPLISPGEMGSSNAQTRFTIGKEEKRTEENRREQSHKLEIIFIKYFLYWSTLAAKREENNGWQAGRLSCLTTPCIIISGPPDTNYGQKGNGKEKPPACFNLCWDWRVEDDNPHQWQD